MLRTAIGVDGKKEIRVNRGEKGKRRKEWGMPLRQRENPNTSISHFTQE